MNAPYCLEKNFHKLCSHKMEIPIFPLNGAVLFPGTNIPLNIFEDRYIEMVDYALANKRYIGMIQLDDKNRLYKIGCLGKINSFSETNDGRYLINLSGSNCFEVNKELKEKYKFRMVSANILPENDNNYKFGDVERTKLINNYKNFIKVKNINIDLNEIEKIELDQLIKFIAMVSPFKDVEKQSLLETKNVFEFYNKLISIIELETFEIQENKSIN